MSATPIPRTLALMLYGDLDISVLDESPAGRLPVKTSLIPSSKRGDMYNFLAKQAAEAIRKARNLIPIIDADGKITGEGLRLNDPGVKTVDAGAVQLNLSWVSRRPSTKMYQKLDRVHISILRAKDKI